MIKQNWELSADEKMRILSLHEDATKKNYLIFEQKDVETQAQELKIHTKNFETYLNFESGFYSEKYTNISNQIDEKILELKNFLKKYKNPKIIDIQIISGESAVKNKDNENKKEGEEAPELKAGDLANLRSETVKRLLNNKLGQLKQSGQINEIPEISTKTIIGKSKIKDSTEAKKEQFVQLKFTVTGEQYCTLENMQITVEYIPVPKGNPKYHCCNNAEYELLLNDTIIPVQNKGTTTINLNNAPTQVSGRDLKDSDRCYAVKETLFISPEIANQIIKKGSPISIELKCLSSGISNDTKKAGCHSSPMFFTVFKNKKAVEYGKYLGYGDEMKQNDIRKIGQMDICGNITVFNPEDNDKLAKQ